MKIIEWLLSLPVLDSALGLYWLLLFIRNWWSWHRSLLVFSTKRWQIVVFLGSYWKSLAQGWFNLDISFHLFFLLTILAYFFIYFIITSFYFVLFSCLLPFNWSLGFLWNKSCWVIDIIWCNQVNNRSAI